MTASRERTHVGFVGLGNIGRPMALTLLRSGWNVTVLDRSADRARALEDAGAQAADAVSGLASCNVLMLAVPDDAAVESVLEGAEGWFEQGGNGRTAVVHSTVMPETASRLAKVAQERGVGFLDAPVSGGADRAEKGDLTIMVGGSQTVLADVRPLLDTLGSQILTLGAPGAGAATKLANQLMMLSTLAGVHEALDLAAAHGVSEERVLAAVASSTGDSWVARNWGFFDRTAAAYDQSGTPPRERPWSKDLFEVVAAARAVNIRVPVAGLLAQTLADRVEAHAARARVVPAAAELHPSRAQSHDGGRQEVRSE